MTNPSKVWRCDNCGARHARESDAGYCCRPSITLGYVCPTCEAFYTEEDQASDCCKTEPEEPRMPTAEELEAAGQGRMIP